MDLVERLLREQRIAVIPGTAFGMDDGCYLRIGYGAADATAMEEGMRPAVQHSAGAALGMRGVRRGVYAGRGLLEPGRRRGLPEGDDARAEARQRAPPGMGDAGGMLNSIGLQNPARVRSSTRSCPRSTSPRRGSSPTCRGPPSRSTLRAYQRRARITRTGMIWTAFRALPVLWSLTRSAGRVVAG